MNQLVKTGLLFITISILMIHCRKKSFEEFYARPDTLEPPVYQVLEKKGNFKHLLAAIDKASYKTILNAAGYWTLFAPHDSAFQVYFASKGINGVDQLDSNTCRQIVTYCLVYNGYTKDRLSDYQGTSSIGWVVNDAFRRRTANYKGVYETVDTSNKPIRAIASNRNNNGTYYVDADYNNKYLPYFITRYMNAKGLTEADYKYFYPATAFSGFNVLDARVTQQDIYAENGMIHIIDKVITSIPSIDEYIGTKPEYSEFKKLFDKFLVQYVFNQVATTKYNNVNTPTGGPVQVFTKVYDPALAFSLNNENFLKTQDNDGQQNSFSIFVPTNTALTGYINSVLLEHYAKLEDMPRAIIYDFINAHLWQSAVWPSKFSSTFNFVNEEARFNPATDVVDKKILSNGIFYGTNKVQEANVFTSVYGKAYLDPQYSMMTSILNLELKPQISNISRSYTLFMISDAMFNAAGYRRDVTVSNDANQQWRYEPPAGSTIPASTGSTTLGRLQRIVNMHVIPDLSLTNLSMEGVALSYGQEYIGFKNNTVYGPGNAEVGNTVSVVSYKQTKNGRVYYIDRMIDPSDVNPGQHLETLGTPVTSQYNYFWQYLKNSALWTAATKEIAGIAAGSYYTFFIPNNQQILKAVNDGQLPGIGMAPAKTPDFNPVSNTDKEIVSRFLMYHVLNKRMVAADGVENGSIETVLKSPLGEPTNIFINNASTGIKLTDMEGRQADVISSTSTYLSNRSFIHLINNYLKYKF